MLSVSTDLNAEVKLQDLSITKAQTAGSVYTAWKPKAGFQAAVLAAGIGTSANTPTSQSLVLSLEDATDSSGTGGAAYKSDGTTAKASVTGISGLKAATDGTCTQFGDNLKNARAYVRGKATIAFVGGSSPANDIALALLMGGTDDTPTTPTNP